MLIKIHKNRSVSSSGTWGTKNENNYEILDFEFPEELEEYNKRIVYYLGNQKVWDPIIDNKAILTNAITTKGSVKAYIWCTKSDEAFETDVDFRTQIFVMNFFENDNADGIVPTPEQVDGFNTMLTAMNNKITEIDALETTIEGAEADRVLAEQGRVNAENTRVSNENTRQSNEQTRQTQEASREQRTNQAIAQITDMTAAYNQNAQQKTEAFNQNATNKTAEFNAVVNEQKDFIEGVGATQANKVAQKGNQALGSITTTTQFALQNISHAQETGVSAVESASSQATTAFNNNATSKTNTFNSNANDKTSAFNDNATQKTTNFDNNASGKTDEFNTNAQEKIDEYDEHIVEYQAQIDELQEEVDELSENMPWAETEQATEISVDDAAKYSKNKMKVFGNTEQTTNIIIYKCDGTETGNYYFIYDNVNYQFTMPIISANDILVFNTDTLKLYLSDTEITTTTDNTGTLITMQNTPNPDYPQPIHVVTGNNSIECNSKNLYNATTQYTSRGIRVECDTQFIYLDGKATSTGSINFPTIPLKKGTYKIMFKLVSGSITSTSDSALFYVYGTGSTSVIRLSDNQKKNSRTFVLNTNGNMYIHLWARTTETFTNAKIAYQVVKGSTDDYNFVPYRLVTYPLELCIGKNRFNISESKLGKSMDTSGSVTDSIYTNLSNYISVKANKTYTLSFKYETLMHTNDRAICYYDKNKVFISGNNYVVANKLFTFTPAQDGYVRFGYDINCYDIQVEEGDTATEYVPYNSLELCKIGNYQDYLYKENGNWYKYNAIDKATLRGGFLSGGVTNVSYYNRITNYAINNNIPFSTHFRGQNNVSGASSANTLPDNSIAFINVSGSTTPRLYIRSTSLNTATLLNNYLAENPVDIYYALQTPTTIQIIDETLISQLDAIYEHLQLVKGTNNISITASDLKPYMELSYMQDLPSKLDNLDSRLSLLE